MSDKLMDKDKEFSAATILKSGNKLLELDKAVVMGILNLTPDSFYSASRIQNSADLLRQTEKYLKEGARIIDLGAVSTRPGAKDISFEAERIRLLDSYYVIRKQFPDIWISIDTWRSKLAEELINVGADIINDISGAKFDPEMMKIIGCNNTPYVLMHIQGTPENMQKNPQYDDIATEINQFFSTQIQAFNSFGANQLIIDPGFGFGKSLEHNYQILNHLEVFLNLKLPILVGVSRKSMIHKLLNITAEEALNGTTVLNTIALQKGAKILRVHDVKEALEAIKIVGM